MYILGLNAYHGDSSACIYRDGQLIAAIEEERIRRIKHWAGLPVEAIRFCLQEAGIGLSEVDVVSISRNPLAKVERKVWHALRNRVSAGAIKDRASNSLKIRGLKQDLAAALGIDPQGWNPQLAFMEHHRSHLASSFFVSPFESAALLSIDGMGDFTSTMRAVGQGNRIRVIDSVTYPHSLGMFYSTFTQYLGFPHYGDEYKVMGLAPYGRPDYADKILPEVIRLKKNGLFELNGHYFRHFREGVQMSWDGGSPAIGTMYTPALAERFGPPRQKDEPLTQYHQDLAASVQAVCEQVIFHLAEDLRRRTGQKNICFSGGVAQNSVANGKLTRNTGYESLFVPPAGHDAGTSVGSALYFWHQKKGHPRGPAARQAYTGSRFSTREIEAIVQKMGLPYVILDEEALYDQVTEALLRPGVVGWFQGRSEFGPRALGNRSILADPRRADAKELLNEKIKRRESFRPFAPSILYDHADDFFEVSDSVPFMEKVFPIRPEKRPLIPAVTHVDGTGRLQTVHPDDNPRYYRLIHTFYQKTGIPILLNTSFNENEPIVNTPQEAIDCFLRTKMDMLVMEEVVLFRL